MAYCTTSPNTTERNAMKAAHLVSSHVSLQQGMLLLQVLNTGQVFAIVIGGQVTLHFIEPQLDVLHVTVKLLLLVGFTQLKA